MNIRMFIADVDNTLMGINAKHMYSPMGKDLCESFEIMHEKGIRIVIASGRPLWQELMIHARDAGLSFQFDMIVGMNGGEIYDDETESVKKYHPLSCEDLEKIVREMDHFDLAPFVYREGYELFSKMDEEFMELAKRHHTRCEVCKDISELWAEPTAKILYRTRSEELCGEIEAYGQKLISERITCFRAQRTMLEFQSPLVNKGFGMLKCCEKFGIDPEEVIAFGDADNDLPMLNKAGLSVAVANAMDSVKKACDDVTEYPALDDGVGHYLKEKIIPLLG
ncbi:MAG: HAD family hydrolase [Erysipelotrichaceae bacterium]|nr:HAD family hydrolase [Erysipelotrichaceae bacterium]